MKAGAAMRSRVRIRTSFSFTLLLLTLHVSIARGETSIHLERSDDPRASEAVLFPFDPYSLTYRHALELTLIPGSKKGIVLKPGPEGAPDGLRIDYYGSVLYMNGKFHMWYRGSSRKEPNYFRVCYATSDDGLTWE